LLYCKPLKKLHPRKPFQKKALEKNPSERRDHNPFQKMLDRNPFEKMLDRNPFQKRLDRKPSKHLNLMNLSPNPIGVINRRNGCGTALFKKGLTENPKNHLSLITLSPNPIGVINRRNGL